MPLHVYGTHYAVDALIDAQAVGIRWGRAVWFAQGILSPGAYINNRTLKSHPHAWDTVIGEQRNLLTRVRHQYASDTVVLASVATGGDHLAAVLAWRLELPLVSVRKEAKAHGAQKGLIDGDPEVLHGAKVFLIEDMSSTFQSCLTAMRSLEMAGAHVVEVFLINTWNLPEFKRNAEPYRVHTLCTGEMILDRMVALGKVDKDHERIMRRWLECPQDETWATSAWTIPVRQVA